MKYAKKPMRSSRTTYRPNYRSGTGNKPVSNIQKKKYTPQRVKNTLSINTLARQVKSLQVTKLGEYQKQLQHANISMQYLNASQPMCFAVNQFSQPVPTGGNVNDYPEVWKLMLNDEPGFAGRWAPWQNSDGQMGIPDRFNQWSGCLDDEISKEVYQPVSASYKFSFKHNMTPSDNPIWIRIDVVRPRKTLRTSTDHELNLPQALPGFAYLAMDEMAHRNRINSTYWGHIVKTKWIKLDATTLHTGNITTNHDVIKRSGFNLKFNDKLKPDFDQGGDTGHQWYLNIPVRKQQWCIISTNKGTTFPEGSSMQIERRIAWRDQHGTSS